MADDFITQVNEEMRAQRLRAMARRFGALAGGVLVVAAIGGGAWAWSSHSRHEAQRVASARYFQTLQTLADPKHDKAATDRAEAAFADLAVHGPVGVRAFAAMRVADMKMQAHDTAGAVQSWQSVADDSKADQGLRGMARYMLLNAQTNTADPKTLRAGYEALAQENGGPWASLAQEGLVALDLRPGSTDANHQEARRLLTQLANSDTATAGSRARAQALLETFGDAG